MKYLLLVSLALFSSFSTASSVDSNAEHVETLIWTPDGFGHQIESQVEDDPVAVPPGSFRIVMINSHTIRLVGTVATPEDKRDAINAVKSIYGVRVIRDDLTITAPQR